MQASRWWIRRQYAWALVALMILPLLWPAVPPLLDLPGHMGRYAVAVGGPDHAGLSRFYGYRWALLGNLGVDLLVFPIAPWLGVEAATKLVVLCIPAIMAAGFLWTARLVHGRLPGTAPLALIFCYAYPLHYGFVNYALSMALVAVAFALWIRTAHAASGARALGFAVIAGAIWISHAIGWVALCALCGTFELHRGLTGNERIGRAVWRTLLACLPLGTGAVLTLISVGPPGVVSGFFGPGMFAKALISLNRDRWIAVDLLTSAILLATILAALLRRLDLRISPALGWPALALFGLFLVIPDSVNDSAFLKTRLLPWAAAYALLAIRVERPEQEARWAALSFGTLAARLAATTWSLLVYDASIGTALKALDKVPVGSRVATFTVNACRPTLANWTNSRRQHLGGLAVVRRQAFVNDQFEAGSLQLLQVRNPAAEPFRHSPSEVVALAPCPQDYPPPFERRLDEMPRDVFDYVWLLDVPRAAWPARPWLTPVYDGGETILYAITPAANRGSASDQR